MFARPLRLPLLVAVFLSCLAAPAAAQSEPLDAAEAALSAVDFPQVRERVREAMASGRLSPERLARAYELLGLAASAEGDDAAARDAYVRLLALAPDADPTRDLAPRLRSPFLEARGFWSSRRDHLSLRATLLDAAHQIRVELTDPIHLAARIEVGVRELGSDEDFRLQTVDATAFVQVPLGEGERFEYYVAVLDEHGNRVAERGRPEAPEIIGDERPMPGAGAQAAGGSDDTILIALGIVAGVLAVGGIVAGVVVPIVTNTRTLAPTITVR